MAFRSNVQSNESLGSRIMKIFYLALAIVLLGISTAQAASVSFTVDPTQNNSPISPYIYGSNGVITGVKNTFYRYGGNRYSALNWATNWSNAGSDYLYENDNYLGDTTNGPAWPFINGHAQDLAAGATTLATFQLAGYASADKSGPVATADYINAANGTSARFLPVLYPKPGAPASYSFPPSTTSGVVYNDEMMAYLVKTLGSAASGGIKFYDLDNEPGLWPNTHKEIHNYPVTYAEILNKGVAMSTLAKSIDPNAKILGPVSSCWSESMSLWGASDSAAWDAIYDNGNWVPYLNFYLAKMQAASSTAGVRLLDYLDWHVYPEDTDSAGNQIGNNDVTQAAAVCRMQTPRDLWDPNYTPNLWISCCVTGYGPIKLIPRLKAAIAQYNPGTNIAFTEYGYGGYSDISGGIAEADFLGILGQYSGMLASVWAFGTQPYLACAFNLYLNYDGSGSKFGDTSILATSNNVPEATVYAAKDSTHANRLDVIILNKDYSNNTPASVTFSNLGGTITSVRAFQFNSTASSISPSNTFSFTANTLTDTLPFRSATLYELTCNLGTPTPTNSPTGSSTATRTFTASATPSATASNTASATASPSRSATATASASPTATSSSTAALPSATATGTATPSITASLTATQTRTATASMTHSPSATSTPSITQTQTLSIYSATSTATVPILTPTGSATPSATASSTPSASPTLSVTPSATLTSTALPSFSATASPAPAPGGVPQVITALAVPNPDPSAIQVHLSRRADSVKVKVWTKALRLIGVFTSGPCPAGWSAVPLPQGLFTANGIYFFTVQASGSSAWSKPGKLMILR
jgi:mannan endo-1,4-beta-mannosidase